MAKKSGTVTHWLQTTTVRVMRVHFLYIAVYIVATVVFDSWNLYTHQAVSQLWTAAGVLLAVITILWYLARMNYANKSFYIFIVLTLILADIIFASYNVYWQHGLASKAVMLFTVPIVTAAALRSRSTLLATTTLCAVAYSTVSVRYFFQNYGLSYRVELWGTIGLYSAIFFVLALILMVIILPKNERF
ncbi:MAG TPA: hypothetical protein VLE51_03610 [Candidatus Saccharimonadales bacterium]|nr:hypothetical protein [Candidatus Saccharimonadales bacterium]